MVRFCKNPYISDGLEGKMGRIKWKVAAGIGLTGVYFISLSSNSNDVFDIYSGVMLKLRQMRKSDMVIIGIAHNAEDANMLVAKMIEDCVSNTGSIENMRRYFASYAGIDCS